MDDGGEIYRADRYGYVGFGVIFGFLISATLVMIVAEQGGEALYALAVFVAAAVYVFVWLRSFRLEIGPESLRYKTLWSDRTVSMADIVKVKFDNAYLATYFGPVVRLTVHLRTPDAPPLVINAKIFSRRAVARVLQLGR